MRIRDLSAIALTLTLLGAAAGDEPRTSTAGLPAPADAPGRDAAPEPAPGRMFFVGRVLDPKGQPVPGAVVAVHARVLAAERPPYREWMRRVTIGRGRADGTGRFRIDAPRTSSARYSNLGAVALASGFGLGWVDLDVDDEQPAADISLRPEQVIQGRLFDLQGRPVPDVTLTVSTIRTERPGETRVRSRSEGVYLGPRIAQDVPAWPMPAKTDAEGRFTMRGVGRDLYAALAAHHPRFALQQVEIQTDGAPGPKAINAALAPAQIVNVRVTRADTGQPVPHATLSVLASSGRIAMSDEVEADDEGRVRVNSWPADRVYTIAAYPPPGQPYLEVVKRVEWPKGSLEQSLDIALPRGALIRGRVTEVGSGQPVAGAMVDFDSRAARQERRRGGIMVRTAPDGSFALGADPSPGVLFVKGPSDDYVLEEIGHDQVGGGRAGMRVLAHAHAALDLKPGTEPKEIHLTLRRAVTVNGQVVGPDGKSVREARIISRIVLAPAIEVWRGWSGVHHGRARDGRFAIHGLDPDVETPVYFLDPRHKLGTTVNLSSKSIALMTLANRTGGAAPGATIAFADRSATRGPISVRLEPCGAARARFVDPDGKPATMALSRNLSISMVVAPGPPRGSAVEKPGAFVALEAEVRQIDTVNYGVDLVSDAEGRLTLPALIPGATYRIVDYTVARGVVPPVRKEFTVKPGQMLDLGDILVEKPPR